MPNKAIVWDVDDDLISDMSQQCILSGQPAESQWTMQN